MSIKRKPKIIYGDVELPNDEFESKNVKVRVTTLIDQDVLLALKALAKKKGKKYQSLLNAILRAHIIDEPHVTRPNFEKRVRQIVHEELRKRA